MSFIKRIYFSPLGYIISCALNAVAFLKKPIMVYGCYNHTQKRFLRNARISSSAVITGKRTLDIDDDVWINHYARIDASGGVKIGKGCQIGYSSVILSHSSHMAVRLNGNKYIHLDIDERIGYIHKRVDIGDFTFIGSGASILPGVKIGKGCVIGVGSVVTKDIPDHSIAVGAPAKVIGSTIETDRAFFEMKEVQERYYDSEIVRKYSEK